MVVLIVSPDESARDLIADVLDCEGSDALPVATAARARRVLAELGASIDLVVVDLALTDADARALVTQVGRELPVAVLIGSNEASPPAEAVAVIPKPVRISSVMGLIERFDRGESRLDAGGREIPLA